MSPTENPEGLLAATNSLIGRVETLDKHLTVARRQARRTRILTFIASFLAVTSVVGVIVTVVLYREVEEATTANQRNAVTSCENANEAREANLTLWMFVLNASAANNPNPTPPELELRQDFEKWVKTLYAPRDCSDMSKKVELPPPPRIAPRS